MKWKDDEVNFNNILKGQNFIYTKFGKTQIINKIEALPISPSKISKIISFKSIDDENKIVIKLGLIVKDYELITYKFLYPSWKNKEQYY